MGTDSGLLSINNESFKELWNFIEQSRVIWVIFENDEHFKVKYISNNISLLGYSVQEFVSNSLNLKSVIHPDDLQIIESQFEIYQNKKQNNFIVEFRFIDGKGDTFWSEARISAIFKDEKIIQCQAMIFDITERKQDQILKEIAYRISDTVTKTHNLEYLLNDIKDILSEVIDTTNFFVALYNKENDTLTLPFYVDEVDKFTEFPARKTMTAYVIKNDIPLLADEEVFLKLEEEGEVELVGSPSKLWMGVPLKTEGEIIGAIVAQSYEDENLYNEFHLEIMKFVSEQVAIAIKRKKSEDALRNSENKYRLIVENSPLGILHFDNKGVVTACNEAHSRIIGSPVEKLIGFNMAQNLADNEVKDLIIKALHGQSSTFEGEYVSTNANRKSIIKAETVPIIDEQNEVVGGISILEDISERKLAEDALRNSEEKLSAIFNNALAGMCILDINGNYKYFNNHWCEMLGYSREELSMFGFLDVTYYEDIENSAKNFKRMFLKEVNNIRLEKRYVKKDATLFWGDLSGSAIYNSEGVIDSLTIIVIDITSKKVAENKILEINEKLSEINATKDKFFSIISHDLRNNLGSFRNVTKLLLDTFEHFTHDEMKESLSLISSTSHRIYILLENLLEWSRSQTGRIPFNPDGFNLYLTVNNIVDLLKVNAKTKSIKLFSEVDEFCYVYADVNMINTVLRNLVTNAIKFTPTNGSISISAIHADDCVQVIVKDSGVGISSENISKLFRIDENITTVGTANEHGSGLGLILCREFIERNSGKIWVESKEGEGSSFIFTLPLGIED